MSVLAILRGIGAAFSFGAKALGLIHDNQVEAAGETKVRAADLQASQKEAVDARASDDSVRAAAGDAVDSELLRDRDAAGHS